MSNTVFKVMVALDTDKVKIKKYEPDNIYNEGTVVEKSEFLKVMDSIKNTGFLPIANKKIRFIDDRWDFKGSLTYVTNESPKFNFTRAPLLYKDIIKYYIFLKIVEGNDKLSTISGYYDKVRGFSQYLVDKQVPIYDITPEFVDSFFDKIKERNVSIFTIQKNIYAVKDFLSHFSEYNPDFKFEPFKRSILFKDYSKELMAAREDGKTSNIPEDFYNKFIQGLLDVIKTERDVVGNNYLGNSSITIACILLLASQIGIRTGEIFQLRTNGIKTIGFKGLDGKQMKGTILNYESWKAAEFDGEVIWCKTVLNEMGQYAFNTLLDIYKEKRKKLNTNFLVMTEKTSELPFSQSTFGGMYMKFLVKFADRLGCINLEDSYKDTLSHITIGDLLKQDLLKKSKSDGRNVEDVIFYPTITQFRVHTISSLINKNVPLPYIKEMMSHLYAETTAGYCRLMEDREKPEEITALYKDIITNDIKIIGPFGKEYNKKIDEFLENYDGSNTHRDFNEIIGKVTEGLPTRIKELGVCIKPTFSRDCSKDSNVDEFYCAYGVCQYIHHTFFMVSKTYEKYGMLLQSYENNLEKGFKMQAQKEKHLVKEIVKNMLIPELDELKLEVDKHGSENIISRYPSLNMIVCNYDEICKEVFKWKEIN